MIFPLLQGPIVATPRQGIGLACIVTAVAVLSGLLFNEITDARHLALQLVELAQ